MIIKSERDDFMHQNKCNDGCSRPTDFGAKPFCVNIMQAACSNDNFRAALWTGCHLQLTLMCIPPHGEIGLEMHSDTDQFLRLESGKATVFMGACKDKMNFKKCVCAGDGVFVPAGTWHNIINTDCCPLKLYSIYAPPKHPHGTIHRTKAIAEASED